MAFIKLLHELDIDTENGFNNHLSYLHSEINLEGLSSMVDKDNPDFAAVSFIYCTGCV